MRAGAGRPAPLRPSGLKGGLNELSARGAVEPCPRCAGRVVLTAAEPAAKIGSRRPLQGSLWDRSAGTISSQPPPMHGALPCAALNAGARYSPILTRSAVISADGLTAGSCHTAGGRRRRSAYRGDSMPMRRVPGPESVRSRVLCLTSTLATHPLADDVRRIHSVPNGRAAWDTKECARRFRSIVCRPPSVRNLRRAPRDRCRGSSILALRSLRSFSLSPQIGDVRFEAEGYG